MKKLIALALAFTTFAGCAYGGAAGVGGGLVVITRNDALLFGLLRQVFVCKVTNSGVSNCAHSEAP